jgi:hypothetical protein
MSFFGQKDYQKKLSETSSRRVHNSELIYGFMFPKLHKSDDNKGSPFTPTQTVTNSR